MWGCLEGIRNSWTAIGSRSDPPTVPVSFSCSFHSLSSLSALSLAQQRKSCSEIYTATMDPSQVDVPPLKDLTIDNITENVHMINSQCPDPRMKYLLERLVSHVHDFARETRLSTNEWMAAIQFLTQVGQISSDVRQVHSTHTPYHSPLIKANTSNSRNSSSSPMSSVSPSSSTA